MTPTVRDAIERLERRKRAAGIGPATMAPLQDVRAVLAGTDLDMQELDELTPAMQMAAVGYTVAAGPGAAGSALWIDGLLVGLELAHMREEEEARDRSDVVDEARDVRSTSRDLVALLDGAAELLDDAGYALRHARFNIATASDCIDLAARIRDRLRS